MVGRIRAGGGCAGAARGWGELSKIPQRRWNRKKGRGKKDFKKGYKLSQREGALKREVWNPLTNYERFCETS